jgi:quercetin dioxygenase-like cupin family protein
VKTVAIKHQFVVNGVQVSVMHAQAGEGIPMHEHPISHMTMCHAGRLAVRKEGVYVELTKDSVPVMLSANGRHELEAIEDGTIFVNMTALTDRLSDA